MTPEALNQVDEGAAGASMPTGALAKAPTGIRGLDEITGGGLPRGRPTLICGSAGCGKTLFGMEFLVKGATEYGEPGVFLAFEETEEELAQNVDHLVHLGLAEYADGQPGPGTRTPDSELFRRKVRLTPAGVDAASSLP